MDVVEYDELVYYQFLLDATEYLESIGFNEVSFVPLSALKCGHEISKPKLVRRIYIV